MLGVGLMSGSSLDGLDLALCSMHCVYDEQTRKVYTIKLNLLDHACIAFSEDLHAKLSKADKLSVAEFVKLDKDLGVFFGISVKTFFKQRPGQKVDFIASHGHTVLHEPKHGYTCQIGSLSHIAAYAGLKTIGDFRNMDMAYGGEGAPMAPLIDKYVFPDTDMFLNLGGIANVSYAHGDKFWGYDIAPANQFFNQLSFKMGFPFDDGGAIAARGQVQIELLNQLEALDFFSLEGPKSLDNIEIREQMWPLVDVFDASVSDKLATCVRLLVRQFEKSILHYLRFNPEGETISIFISGGGAKNTFLVDQLLNLSCEKYRLVNHQADPAISDMKEAMLMVLAGGLRMLELPNIFSSVTGADRDSVGGGIFYPK
jgi:anhydro-N-acetylmuramic acid kinase